MLSWEEELLPLGISRLLPDYFFPNTGLSLFYSRGRLIIYRENVSITPI